MSPSWTERTATLARLWAALHRERQQTAYVGIAFRVSAPAVAKSRSQRCTAKPLNPAATATSTSNQHQDSQEEEEGSGGGSLGMSWQTRCVCMREREIKFVLRIPGPKFQHVSRTSA
jgi:hypothetical protein